jgi:antitoxin YqcF
MTVDLKSIARREATVFGGTPAVTRHWDDDERRWVDVLRCVDRPDEGLTSWATIGASQYDNRVSNAAGPLRVEFVGACASAWPTYANMLVTCALNVASGDYSATPGIIMPGVVAMYEKSVTTRHMLLTDPFLWDGEFPSLSGDDYSVAWLMGVPVTDAEFEFAGAEGVDALEELFSAAEIDVFDLDRPSVR